MATYSIGDLSRREILKMSAVLSIASGDLRLGHAGNLERQGDVPGRRT